MCHDRCEREVEGKKIHRKIISIFGGLISDFFCADQVSVVDWHCTNSLYCLLILDRSLTCTYTPAQYGYGAVRFVFLLK